MDIYNTTRKLALVSAISLTILASSASMATPDQASGIRDARQSSQIWTTYALNSHLQAHHIDVSVTNGVATLTGTVNDDIGRELAEQIALNVEGISKVNNNIEVDPDHQPKKDADERSYRDAVSDAAITATVKSKLLWSKHAQGLSANVETRSGVVTLTGTAHTAEAKEIAELLANNTEGVTKVHNKLKVQKSRDKETKGDDQKTNIGQTISDAWITTKVKSTLIYSSNISSSDISVTTQDGVVILSGNVDTDAERSLAIALAKNVNGVKSVNSDALKESKK